MAEDKTFNDDDALEQRLAAIESKLQFAERIVAAELRMSAVRSADPQPWWRNGRTVTTIVALVAAIMPIITGVDAVIASHFAHQRQELDEQNRIRQLYLDRVLRPGVSEADQKRLFSLLAKLKGDPEFQDWAKDQLKSASDKIDELKAAIETLKLENGKLASEIAQAQDDETKKRLEAELARGTEELRKLADRVDNIPSTDQLTCDVAVTSRIPGVIVQVKPVGTPDAMVRTVITDAVLKNVYRGIYQLTASKPGYVTRVMQLDLISADQKTTVDVTLVQQTGI